MHSNGRGLYVGGRAAQCGSNECRGGLTAIMVVPPWERAVMVMGRKRVMWVHMDGDAEVGATGEYC